MSAQTLPNELVYSPMDLANQPFDVLIVGSGPAGVAIAEGLYAEGVERIGILERGGILTTAGVRNLLSDSERKEFITAHEAFLWEGDLGATGMMLPALGGRGIVAGAHLPRFYREDFHAWSHDPEKELRGQWPIALSELDNYYARAEHSRPASPSGTGASQTWALSNLGHFRALPPSWGMDARSANDREDRNDDSSVGRLWELIQRDFSRGLKGGTKRLMVMPNTLVTEIRLRDDYTVGELICPGMNYGPICLRANHFVLAASPIESARLFLDSGLGQDRPAAGRYLAEHIYCRGTLRVEAPGQDRSDQFLSVIVPPQLLRGNDTAGRFHINVEGWPDPDVIGSIVVRVTGSAAMDPSPENRITLCTDKSGWRKAHTSLDYSPGDCTRTDSMLSKILEIKHALGGVWTEEPELMPKGRSHHEAGTLRMGTDTSVSVVDPHGRVHGIENLFVADAAVFPCVGVANPMLTVTAWSYRLADYITTLLRSR